jgi:hypothetical protein
MAELMGCLGCDGVYAVGLPVCPECGTVSPRFEGVEDRVPKATSGGASSAWEETPVAEAPAEASPAQAAPEPPAYVARAAVVDDPVTPSGDEAPDIATGSGMEVLAAPDAPEPLSPADVAAGYTDLSYAELRAEAKARGLPAGGSAVELAARLSEHDETQAASDTAGAATEGGG